MDSNYRFFFLYSGILVWQLQKMMTGSENKINHQYSQLCTVQVHSAWNRL